MWEGARAVINFAAVRRGCVINRGISRRNRASASRGMIARLSDFSDSFVVPLEPDLRRLFDGGS